MTVFRLGSRAGKQPRPAASLFIRFSAHSSHSLASPSRMSTEERKQQMAAAGGGQEQRNSSKRKRDTGCRAVASTALSKASNRNQSTSGARLLSSSWLTAAIACLPLCATAATTGTAAAGGGEAGAGGVGAGGAPAPAVGSSGAMKLPGSFDLKVSARASLFCACNCVRSSGPCPLMPRSHPVSDGVRGAAPRPSPCARLEKHAGGRGQSGCLLHLFSF
jgi:hypothetical protein